MPLLIALDRRIEKLLDLGKGDDLVKLAHDLGAGHAEDRAVEKDVLAAGQFRMKAGADFEQARDPAAQDRASARRLGDPAQNLQQRRFAGAVASDDAEHLAALDLEAHILQRPEFLDLVALHDLPAADKIDRLARKIPRLARRSRRAARCSARARPTDGRPGSAWRDSRRR